MPKDMKIKNRLFTNEWNGAHEYNNNRKHT